MRRAQVARLAGLKRDRDADAVRAALDALTRCAETAEGNLLDLAVEAARRRATLGEISSALEKVFGRYQATHRTISGVYSAESASDAEFRKAREMARRVRDGRKAGACASSSPRWARTATTAARR